MNKIVAEAQALGWKIAIVRRIHGASADAWTVDEMLDEFRRMRETVVRVNDQQGMSSTMTELELRLAYEPVR